MGLFHYLSDAVSIAFEINFYILSSGVTYLLMKLAELHLRNRRGYTAELFPKRLTPKHSLVLELDETILLSLKAPGDNTTPSVALNVGNRVHHFLVEKRPHLDTFLMEMRNHYEIVLYTTSEQRYADACLNYACVNHLFDRKLYRKDCVIGPDGVYAKDPTKVCSDLSKVLMMEKASNADERFQSNTLTMYSWSGAQSDTALLDIMPLLEALSHVDDVRHVLELRCGNLQTYSSFDAAGNLDAADSPTVATEIPPPWESSELWSGVQNCQAIGQRLTTRVKQIFAPGADNPLHTPERSSETSPQASVN